MGDVLIAGGYGEVGGRIAADLLRDHGGRLILAGRHPRHGEAMSSRLGAGVRARRIDVEDDLSIAAALGGVDVVVSCIDQRERRLLSAAISRGLGYVDITPHLTRWRDSKEFQPRARKTGARVILAAGLCPGITSVIARFAAERVGPLDRIETSLLLSAGDAFGRASLDYLLEEVSESFNVRVDGAERTIRPFEDAAVVDFGPPIGLRTAYAFPFSDQVFYPLTLGVDTAISRLAIGPAWLGELVARLGRRGMIPAASSGLAGALKTIVSGAKGLLPQSGKTRFAVVVDMRGRGGSLRAELGGRTQAAATAAGAAAIVRALEDGDVPPGAWLPEEVISPKPFFDRLTAEGLTVSWHLSSVAAPALAKSS